jgi:hypothetical protein
MDVIVDLYFFVRNNGVPGKNQFRFHGNVVRVSRAGELR